MNNALYVRRRNRLFLEPGTENLPENYTAALLKNIEPLGYTFSESLIAVVRTQSLVALTRFYGETVAALREMTGAHRPFQPMYPNFPEQVLEMSDARLYLNAIFHYLTNQLPSFEKSERLPLLDKANPKIIELGTITEFEDIFTQVTGADTSLSATDKADVKWFVENYRNDVFRLLPEVIPQKENLAYIGGLLLTSTDSGQEYLSSRVKTATDVLRLAVAMSDGDVSLAKATKFRSFKRSERRRLLALLENSGNIAEDFLRWKKRWIRLGERLHVGEYAKAFPRTFEAFDIVRNDRPFLTFNGQIERALIDKDLDAVRKLLSSRPGDFARRLDHLFRLDESRSAEILGSFSELAADVSTPVLLQVKTHFENRNDAGRLRVFFPKGDVAKLFAVENELNPLNSKVCAAVVETCRQVLVQRFSKLPPLGKSFLDPNLQNYLVPFSQRSASKSLRTLPRGSRIDLPDTNVIRLFLWWKNGRSRTDIDLSAALYDEDFGYKDVVSYYNLKNYGGHHSGDIVDAPNGAAEFIDIDRAKTLEMGIRYVVVSLNSFTEQPYCDLPECFAGWMARRSANSGEIFEARTVENRVDLASDTRICLPMIVDLFDRKVIWTDIALKSSPQLNNVDQNLSGVSLMIRAMLSLRKASLYDLFEMHIQARGERVDSISDANQIFSVNEGLTPYDIETIAAEYLQ